MTVRQAAGTGIHRKRWTTGTDQVRMTLVWPVSVQKIRFLMRANTEPAAPGVSFQERERIYPQGSPAGSGADAGCRVGGVRPSERQAGCPLGRISEHS